MVRAVRPGGTVVIVGFTSMRLMLQQSNLGPRAGKRHGITWSPPESRVPGPEHAEALRDLLESGAVGPEIEARYTSYNFV